MNLFPVRPARNHARHASAGKYMLVKQQPQISEKELAEFFPEADLILLEGFKYSTDSASLSSASRFVAIAISFFGLQTLSAEFP